MASTFFNYNSIEPLDAYILLVWISLKFSFHFSRSPLTKDDCFFLFALLRLNTLFSHLCAELTKDLETNRSKNWNIALLLEKKWFFLFCCWWNSCIFYLEKKGTVNWAVRAWNKHHWTLVHLSYVNSEKRRNSSKSSACRLESRNGHLNWSW